MTFDEQAGGHRFNFEGVCDRCGISRKQFEDTGEPRCAGKKPDQPNPRGMVVDAETGEIEPAPSPTRP